MYSVSALILKSVEVGIDVAGIMSKEYYIDCNGI